ncbi:MAG: aspartate kinase [Thermoguttaceae bacterium]|nr:aspartate kinase [Thermoguttaceae bacterium]
MSIIVQKFGGTSVADSNKILAAARKAIRAQEEGHQVVMVVSAMGKNTDKLIALAKEIEENPPAREMDMLLSTGEQVSVALVAIAIQHLGYKAVSMTGAQIGIKTNNSFMKARIESISTDRIRKALNDGNIVIAAGFQGVDDNYNITTLGRGGSDTTAVALAAVLNAESCEIYTDVDGVYTADPRVVPKARRVKQISYDEMLEMASLGAGVMHSRSIEFAKNFQVPIHVRASYSDEPGTMIVSEPESTERPVCGAAIAKDEVRFSIVGIADRPGMTDQIFHPIANRQIAMDMVVQNIGIDGKAEIAFTIPATELSSTLKAIAEVKENIPDAFESYTYDNNLCKVSIVGLGMERQVGVAEKMFETLAARGINIQMITTSEIKVSVLVSKDQGAEAIRAVHDAFELGITPSDVKPLVKPQMISDEEKIRLINRLEHMEDLLIENVTLDETQASVTLFDLPQEPGLASRIFRRVTEAGIVVDMIVQSSGDKFTNLTFTVERSCADAALELAKEIAAKLNCTPPKSCPPVAKISLSGTGMRSHTLVAARILETLAEAGINIEMINTSEMRFNLVVEAKDGQRALAVLKDELKDVIAD